MGRLSLIGKRLPMNGTVLMDSMAALATLVFVTYGGWTLPLAQAPSPAPQAVEFNIEASRFKYEPSRIEVTQGDRVRIVVHSDDGTHGFSIKKLKINKLIPQGGAPVTIEFVAGEPGSYEIVCSEECGTGHMEMKGLLVVVPRDSASLPSSIAP